MDDLSRQWWPQAQSRIETRARAGSAPVISGYASVFFDEDKPGTEYRLGDGYVEHVHPDAFSRSLLEKQDTLGLFNHDASLILGRVSAGTLKLSTDSVGLRYDIELAAQTSTARDVVENIKVGNITGSSFGFIVRESEVEHSGDKTIRVIRDVDLFDVGPVSSPAYPATTADQVRRRSAIFLDFATKRISELSKNED